MSPRAATRLADLKHLLLALVLSGLSGWAGAAPAAADAAPADAVWHCSRASQSTGGASPEDLENSFQLASSNVNSEAIGLSLLDLMDAYSGKTVLLNGRALTACFMPGGSALSSGALASLGLNWSSMQQMARKSAIVQSNLQLVTDEAAMLACITKGFPAVGYLSEPTQNDRVVPCF